MLKQNDKQARGIFQILTKLCGKHFIEIIALINVFFFTGRYLIVLLLGLRRHASARWNTVGEVWRKVLPRAGNPVNGNFHAAHPGGRRVG